MLPTADLDLFPGLLFIYPAIQDRGVGPDIMDQGLNRPRYLQELGFVPAHDEPACSEEIRQLLLIEARYSSECSEF